MISIAAAVGPTVASGPATRTSVPVRVADVGFGPRTGVFIYGKIRYEATSKAVKPISRAVDSDRTAA